MEGLNQRTPKSKLQWSGGAPTAPIAPGTPTTPGTREGEAAAQDSLSLNSGSLWS